MEEELPYKKGRKLRNKTEDISHLLYGKVPPQARELEEAVLGALLIEKEAYLYVGEFLVPENFYVDAHAKIYRAIQDLSANSNPIDILSVTEALRKGGQLENVGGAFYISELTNKVGSSANIEFHARIIQQKYLQRELIRLSNDIIRDSYEDTTDVFDLLDEATTKLYELNNQISGSNIKSATQIKEKILKDIIEIKSGTKQSGIIDTCLSWIKLQLGCVTIIAAKPGTGKTAFATASARVQAEAGYNVGIKSIEMTDTKLTARILQQDTKISAKRVINGQVDSDEFDRIKSTVVSDRIYIDATARVTQNNIRNQLIGFIMKHGCKVIYIDYFQKIVLTGKKTTTDNQYDVFENLCQIAKEYDVALCIFSQFSRGGEKEEDTDWLEKLKGGGLEQGASEVYVFIDKHLMPILLVLNNYGLEL